MGRADTILTCALITLSFYQIVYQTPILNDTQTNNVILGENDSGSDLSTEEENIENNAPDKVIEEIRTRVLRSLHRTEAPKKIAPLPRLQSLNPEDHSTGNNSSGINPNNIKTDCVLADVENITNNGITFMKIQFNFQEVNNIQLAEMWIYKTQNVREYNITRIFKNGNERQQFTFHINNQTEEAGWTRFDVSSFITTDNFTGLKFQVSEEDSFKLGTEGDNNPFLLLHKMMSVKNISKRSASNCSNENTNDSSPCCLHDLKINFAEIGFDTWIIHPQEYNANYCKGTCDVSNLSNHRAMIMHALCEMYPEKAEELGIRECVSCGNTNYTSITIVYQDEEGSHLISFLPGMSVTECGCT